MFDALHLSATDFAWILLSVVVGALVQGSIGFGLNLIVVPVAAWLRPDSLPSTMILMSLPLTAGSALRESAHIDRSGVLWTTIGRLPGVALGAWVVAVLEPDALATLIGGIVVVSALLSVLAPEIPISRGSAAGVGPSGRGVQADRVTPAASTVSTETTPVTRVAIGVQVTIGADVMGL